jgi:hypothetical protein
VESLQASVGALADCGYARKHATQVAPTSAKRLRGSPEGVDAAPTKLSDEAGVGRVDVVACILDHLSNRTYGREAWFPPKSHLRGLNFLVLRQGTKFAEFTFNEVG